MFDRFDANGDGQLDKGEVMAMLKARAERRGSAAPDDASVKQFIDRFDTDRNGTVSQAELQAMVRERGTDRSE